MSSPLARLTAKHLAIVGAIVVVTLAMLAIGDPLGHPGAGEQATGERGLSGAPRIVFYAGLAIAFVLALPPRQGRTGGDGDDT